MTANPSIFDYWRGGEPNRIVIDPASGTNNFDYWRSSEPVRTLLQPVPISSTATLSAVNTLPQIVAVGSNTVPSAQSLITNNYAVGSNITTTAQALLTDTHTVGSIITIIGNCVQGLPTIYTLTGSTIVSHASAINIIQAGSGYFYKDDVINSSLLGDASVITTLTALGVIA